MSNPPEEDYAKALVESWMLNPPFAAKLFKFGRYFFYAAFFLLFSIGLLTTQHGQSRFFDDPRGMQLMGGLLFFWGAHMLAFKNEWAEANANLMKSVFSNKSDWFWAQAIYKQQTSTDYQRLIGSVGGVGMMFVGGLLFLGSLSARQTTQFPPNQGIERPAAR